MKKLKESLFCVYALLLDGDLVYIGSTNNITNRLNYHNGKKKFNDYLIIKEFKTRSESLFFEKSIIYFLSVFQSEKVINSTYQSVSSFKYYLKNG
jgi:predicted GIY-YIG superfamily endonuclease